MAAFEKWAFSQQKFIRSKNGGFWDKDEAAAAAMALVAGAVR
jgi:hypothetical protein